jgi:phage shock protein PspC (stress-responsive transcriptional regulator)
MDRNSTDKWMGGVIGGIARTLGVGSGILRVIFLVLFLGIGGLSFGIGWGAVSIIYLLCWMILPVR